LADITASVVVPSKTAVTAPIVITTAGGGDFFAADPFALYQVRAANGAGVTQTITVDDPTTPAVPGATTAVNPDVPFAIPATSQRYFVIDAKRHRDPVTGRINLAYSAVVTLTLEITKVGG
jgi:hypothetical protein